MTARAEPARALVSTAAALADSPSLPSLNALRDLVEAAFAAERADPPELRPRDSGGEPGGLLLLPARPTVLVPDIHARPGLLARVLSWTGPKEAPFAADLAELLARREASLVCLGDVFHSEWGEASRRWQGALREYATGWAAHRRMDEEMALTLSAVRIVLEAKVLFGPAFHYLKGNHDNVANDSEHGDRQFYKFAAEGEMVSSWFELAYGIGLRSRFRELELEYPILAVGEGFVASHGEPAFALGPEDLIEYRRRSEVVHALIWTANDEARPGSVEDSLAALLGPQAAAGGARGPALWFGGHRPVEGRYALRAGGRYVQFHDPSRYQVALLLPGRAPAAERDIHLL